MARCRSGLLSRAALHTRYNKLPNEKHGLGARSPRCEKRPACIHLIYGLTGVFMNNEHHITLTR